MNRYVRTFLLSQFWLVVGILLFLVTLAPIGLMAYTRNLLALLLYLPLIGLAVTFHTWEDKR